MQVDICVIHCLPQGAVSPEVYHFLMFENSKLICTRLNIGLTQYLEQFRIIQSYMYISGVCTSDCRNCFLLVT